MSGFPTFPARPAVQQAEQARLLGEREAALHDLFTRIERERKATLEQFALIVRDEQSAKR